MKKQIELFDGRLVFSGENVAIINVAEIIERMGKEKKYLEKEYGTLVAEGKKNRDTLKRMRQLKERIQEAAEHLDEMEMEMQAMCWRIASGRRPGGLADWRGSWIKKRIADGDSNGVREILQDKQCRREMIMAKEGLDLALMTVEAEKKTIQEYIYGQSALIAMMEDKEENEARIIAIYKEITGLAKKYRIGMEVLSDYEEFMKNRKRLPADS